MHGQAIAPRARTPHPAVPELPSSGTATTDDGGPLIVDALSPAAAVASLALSAPQTLSITSDRGDLSAAALTDQASRLAAHLTAIGTRPGDRVAYVGRNSPATLVTVLACAWTGAVAVPLSFRLAPAELATTLAHCGATAVVVGRGSVATAVEAQPLLGHVRWIVDDEHQSTSSAPAPGTVLAGREPDVTVRAPDPTMRNPDLVGWVSPGWDRRGWDSLSALGEVPDAARTDPLPRDGDDLAVLLYTSGTSGRPKGVMLTWGNLAWATRNIESEIKTRPDDVTLAVAPMFHVGGLNALTLSTLVRGGTVVVRETFDAQRTLDDLRDGQITSVFGVPAMFAAIARCPDFATSDLSGVRAALVAGALVPEGLLADYLSRGIRLQTSWGMTETAPAVTCVPRHLTASKPGSAGRPLPYTEVRLRDRDGDLVTEPGRTGEITVRGPNVTRGYWADPEATAAVLSPDGWLRTGDLARWDEDGFVTIVGRCTDMINTGGEKVYPAEVERALRDLPGVSEVVVLGVPDLTWGETVAAVLECPVPVDIEVVQAVAARTIARYKLPRVLLCLPELPRTDSGKVDRRGLRDTLNAAARDAPPAPASP